MVILVVSVGWLAIHRAEADPSLVLLSARDQIPGSFLQDQTIYADKERIYLASSEGVLFVLARDRLADFPLIQGVDLGVSLAAVRGDRNYLYVSAADGELKIFCKTWPLRLVKTVPLSDFGLNSLTVLGSDLYVSRGQAEMEVDQSRVYLSMLNEGEVGLGLKKNNLDAPIGLIYGQIFSPWVTEVYDRRTAVVVGRIANPASSQVALFGDRACLYQTVPGCCGPGIFVYRKDTLTLNQFIARPATNTVAVVNQAGVNFLIGGTEGGSVDLFDLFLDPSPLVSSVDLRTATGHTGAEDIEIRALWFDGLDNLVLAASSWGNDSSRGPDLPSFFVLEVLGLK